MTWTKDPDAVLDYCVDWKEWLGEDTIATSEWVNVTAGITIDSATFTDTAALVWLSGGGVDNFGAPYRLTNRITTAGGRHDERTVTVTVKAK